MLATGTENKGGKSWSRNRILCCRSGALNIDKGIIPAYNNDVDINRNNRDL